MSLEDIVNVQISRETASVSRQGFGTPLILGINKGFTALAATYSSLAAVAEDFSTTSKEYKAAQAFFSQSPKVVQVKIGRRATSDTAVITVDTVVDSTTYTCTINGTVFSVNSGVGATAASIAGLLETAINAGSEPVTATDNLDGTYDLDADVASTAYSVKVDVNQSAAFTTSTTADADLASISGEDDDWYGLVYTERTQSDVEAIAGYIETVRKIFGTASADADIAGTTDAADTTTVAAVLKAAAYARTFVMYLSNAATQYPEAALLGVLLPLDPGSYTAKFKTLSGITRDVNTSTQRTNILAKNATQYTTVGGQNITEDGKVSEGEFIDVIIFVDWLEARITEGVYGKLVNTPKLPFTDAGIGVVEAEINKVLQDGITLGGIAPDPAFSISVPKAADVSAGDKAARTLNNVTFQATLAGAIHAVTINGTVTV